jgi:hypothetical protein
MKYRATIRPEAEKFFNPDKDKDDFMIYLKR